MNPEEINKIAVMVGQVFGEMMADKADNDARRVRFGRIREHASVIYREIMQYNGWTPETFHTSAEQAVAAAVVFDQVFAAYVDKTSEPPQVVRQEIVIEYTEPVSFFEFSDIQNPAKLVDIEPRPESFNATHFSVGDKIQLKFKEPVSRVRIILDGLGLVSSQAVPIMPAPIEEPAPVDRAEGMDAQKPGFSDA